MKTLLVSGGAGFIGSNFTRYLLQTYPDLRVVVYDKLTYAGRLENLQDVAADFAGRYAFVRGDIADRPLVEAMVGEHGVDTIVNSYVGPFTSIYHHCVVENSEIEHSIILENCEIRDLPARLEDSLIGRNVVIGRSPVKPKAYKMILGDHSQVGVL